MAKGLCELRGRQCAKRRGNPKSKTTNSPDVQPIAYPLIHLHILALNVECLHGKMNSLKELALALSFLVRNLRWNIRMTSISRLNPCGFAFKQRHIQRMQFFPHLTLLLLRMPQSAFTGIVMLATWPEPLP